jgi:YVTN family beta-propeller protein
MYRHNRNGRRATSARECMAVCAVPAMGLGLLASLAEAAPFAYVANEGSGTVSVIDTATIPPSVVATVPVATFPNAPFGVAVTPDRAQAFVANNGFPGTVSVIDTATNTVGATITAGSGSRGVAITPDGTHAYVVNDTDPGTVSVIDTATTPPSARAKARALAACVFGSFHRNGTPI